MRTGKSRTNRSNKQVAGKSKAMQQRLLRALDRVLDSATGTGLGAFSLEQLEPRTFLSATIAANQFTVLDDGAGAPAAAGVIALDSTTTAAVQAEITTTNGTPDQASTIVIDLDPTDAHSAGFTYNVKLFMDGTNASSAPTITFSHQDAGDVVNLTVYNEQIDDNAGASAFTPEGHTSGFTAANYIADTNYTGPDPTANDITGSDGGNFAARGAIGTTTIASSFGGGTVAFHNTGSSNIGAVSFTGGVDISGGTSMAVTGNPSVVITGDVTLGNNNLTITLPDTGTASVAAGATINVNGSGNLAVNGTANVGALTFGDVTTAQSGATTGGVAVTITTNATGTISFGDVTLGDAGENDTGGVAVGVGGTAAGFSFGDILINSTGAGAGVGVVVTGTSAGDFTTGDITASGTGTQQGSVGLASGGTIGNVSLGDVTLGDLGSADSSGVLISSLANNGAVGNISVGTITLNGVFNAFSIDSDGTGAIGTVALGDITMAGSGGVHVGHSAATSLGNISLGDLTETDTDSGSLTLQAATMGNVTVGSLWTFAGGGGVVIAASTGSIGNLGPANADTWDFDFVDGNNTTVTISADDGIGTITFSSVDYGDALDGVFDIDADNDGGTELTSGTQSGSLGDFTITSQGDNSVGTNDTAFIGTVNALTGGDINFAGGAVDSSFTAGNQNLLAHTGGPGVWGDISFAGDSPDDTINAQDGISSITVTGTDARFVGATVNANTDTGTETTTGAGGSVSDAVGGLGLVSVSGSAGNNSLTGTFQGLSLGGFTLSNGFMDVTAFTNVSGPDAQAAVTTSSIGPITVTTNGNTTAGGAITDGSFTADDGVGAITVGNLAPANATVNIGNIITDNDGTAAIATATSSTTNFGGTFGGITAQGAVTVANLITHEDGNFVGAVADHTFRASQTSGNIQAGGSISLPNVDVGGDLLMITVVETPATAGADTITIGNLIVNGNVDNIATSLGAGDNITISNASTIRGDLDRINAGAGNVSIPIGLHVIAGTSGSPVYVITDDGVDYILDISGTWSAGTNQATIDTTLVFAGGDNNSVTINDLEGATSVNDTVLEIATRADPLGANTLATYATGLGTDDSNAKFNLNGFLDDYGAGQDGRHSLKELLIEGDLFGSIGNDPNPSDGTSQTIASSAPILGTIENLEIVGTWHNNTGTIFVEGLGDLSYGDLSTDRIAGTPGKQFSFDSPSGQGGDGVLANAGNANGTNEDLEVYSALAGSNQTDIVLTIPDGGFLTKSFVGPTGAFETIRLTDDDADGVVDTAVISFSGGVITDIHLFGQAIGIEFNTLDPDAGNAATNSSTTIVYGQNADGILATTPTNGDNAIDFLEFSSTIGSVTVNHVDTVDKTVPENVGTILVGFTVTEDGFSDADLNHSGSVSSREFRDFINDPGDGTGATGLTVANNTAIDYGSIGAIAIDGSLGPVLTSGSVASIATTDTDLATDVGSDGIHDASFVGLVADGSSGAITIDGNVTRSLVVGDRTLVSFGADGLLGGGDDVIGIAGTPGFTGDITVHGSLGTTGGDVDDVIGDGNDITDGGPDGNAQTPSPSGGNNATPSNQDGDQVSTPDGLSANINVDEALVASVISGKRALLYTTVGGVLTPGDNDTTNDPTGQANDNITGNITASEIFGDIWSGEQINGNITATGTGVLYSPTGTSPDASRYGAIGGLSDNNSTLDIIATGGSSGDITGNITATGNITNVNIVAGTGTGGSVLGNIIAGTDGTGGITGTNFLSADNSIGAAGNTNVVSSADSQSWQIVQSGLESDKVTFGGDINSDFLAGVAIGATAPVSTNINDLNLPIFQNEDDSITITTLQAGWTQDGVDQDGNAQDDLNSNLNGTFAAAGSVSINTFDIDGNAVGNDGLPGGHIAAAGLGDKDADGISVDDQNELFIGGGTISGTLSGTFSAGLFVPADTASASPLNPNDVGPLLGGTVLTTGAVDITLTTGVWDQSHTGASGSGGVTLPNLIAGTDLGVVSGFVPAFSVGATCNIELDIDVVGLPFNPLTQTGPGNVTPNPETGTTSNVSIAAFGSVDGTVTVAGSADFNLVLANIDAVTAFDGSLDGSTVGGSGHVVNPSAPSTLVPLQSGSIVNNPTPGNVASSLGIDNNLSIASNGNTSGGLNVDYYLAGLDYFVQETGADHTQAAFWSSFGFGSIGTTHRTPTLSASDAAPTNGFQAGNLTFDLIAAGQNVKVNLIADNDIESGLGNAGIENGLIPTVGADAFDADIVAGGDARSIISPLAQVGSFSGGNVSGTISAGDDILSSSNPHSELTIAAIGNHTSGTGNVSSAITSGTQPQFGTPGDEVSNINAFIIAGDSVSSNIDAGDTAAFGGDNAGAFTGGIWAGAGVDLDINATTDNSFGLSGSITGTIRTGGSLDAIQGIYAQYDINVIEVGFGDGTYQLLGNVAAEHDINEIQVWGDLGSADNAGTIAAGDHIVSIGVGNASGIAANSGDFARLTHPSDEYINTFGTIFDNIVTTNGVTNLFYVTLDANATITGGNANPVSSFTLDQNGVITTYTFTGGEGIFVVGPNGVDIYAFSSHEATDGNGGLPISLKVSGPAGIDKFIAVDGVDELDVYNGSVNQIIISDSFDAVGAITAALGSVTDPFAAFPFITDSLVTSSPATTIGPSVGNDKVPIDANFINVAGNIGTGASLTTSLTGLTPADNVALFIEGNLVGGVTSETGSIGNIVVGGQDSVLFNGDNGFEEDNVGIGNAQIKARNNIGDVYAGLGGFGFGGEGFIEAQTGSLGILSVQDGINLDENINTANDGAILSVAENIGGLVSRTSEIGNLVDTAATISDLDTHNSPDDFDTGVHVHGSIGLIQASGEIGGIFIAETGSIGIDLRPSAANYVTAFVDSTHAGISNDIGDIIINAAAGTSIGNIEAKAGNIGEMGNGDGENGADVNGMNDTIPTVLVANGGVSIDPDTLLYVASPNGRGGVGSVISDIGNINVQVTTGGDVGTSPDITSAVRGGIVAPLGEVDALLYVGGNVGGLSGQLVELDPSSVILGSLGLVRNLDGGSVEGGAGNGGSFFSVQGITKNNPLIIVTDDIDNNIVDYRVDIQDNGTATVVYHVADDGTVEFDSVTYTPDTDPNTTGGIAITTQNGNSGRTLNPFDVGYVDSNKGTTQVDDLVVNGSVANVIVEGDLDSLTVNGNLAGGNLNVGSLGDATVTGNIGTAQAHEGVHVTSGSFGSLNAGGSNFGLTTVTIDSNSKTTAPQFISVGNTLNPGVGEAFTNFYIGSGSATATINNGAISGITFTGTSASNVVIVSSPTAMTADQLKAQAALVAKNQTSATVKGATVLNEVGTGGSSNSAFAARIMATNTKFKMNGLIVEGNLDMALQGSASNVTVTGNASRLLATLGLTKVVIDGNAGVVDGGVTVSNLVVNGAADVIKATRTVSNVLVQGNAGVVSSGGTMSKVFIGGSSISIGAKTMSDVLVDGSVGASIDVDSSQSSGLGLGAIRHIGNGLVSGFTEGQLADLLGVDEADLSTLGDRGPLYYAIQTPGEYDEDFDETVDYSALFYGGLEAHTAKNVVVIGNISDTVITGSAAGSDSLFNDTIDDAYMKIGKKVFTKVNGVIGQVIADPTLVVVAGNLVNPTVI